MPSTVINNRKIFLMSPDHKTMEPQLLEVNFNSDCKRACEYYPEFFNDVFSVMFLDDCDGHNVAILE